VAQPGRREVERGLTVGERAHHTGATPDLTQDALERIVNRYEKCGADVPLQLCLAAAYGATIRDRGSGSTKVRAGRSVR
jgi:hypothetical protein